MQSQYHTVFSEQSKPCQLYHNLHPLIELTMNCSTKVLLEASIIEIPASCVPARHLILKSSVPHIPLSWGSRVNIRSPLRCKRAIIEIYSFLKRAVAVGRAKSTGKCLSMALLCPVLQNKHWSTIHHNTPSSGSLVCAPFSTAATLPMQPLYIVTNLLLKGYFYSLLQDMNWGCFGESFMLLH